MHNTEEAARKVVRQMPELSSLKQRLETERPEVRRAAANVLRDWAEGSDLFDRMPEMTSEEIQALVVGMKAEIARRERAGRTD